MKNTPRFIAIEGIDGAGKDTLAEGLEVYFAEDGLDVVVTNEPSDGSLGQHIRKILDGKVPAPPTNFEFQSLYVKDRLAHIRTCIRPRMALGSLVISVCYWLSTLAYGMLESPLERYLKLHSDIINGEMLYPHLTLILDLDVGEALGRIQKAGRDFDWFAKAEKLEKIRANYLEFANRPELGKIAVIDANRSKEEVLESALCAIKPLL